MHLRLLIICLIASLSSIAQSGYKIDFKINGLRDTTVFLGYYNGGQHWVRDTTKVNDQGQFSFDGSKSLLQGIYFLILKNRILFEPGFVVGDDQQFSIETDTADYVRKLKVAGDEDNRLFFENIRFISERYKEGDPYLKILKDSAISENKKTEVRENFKKVNDKVVAFQDELITKHPKTVTARLLKSTKQIEIPEPPKKPDGSIDSTFQLRYYRDHYFDNFDLADDALLHVPKSAYAEKVKDYLDRLFIQQPDSLMKAIDNLVTVAKKNKETYKFLVWTCIGYYQTHKIMGLDEVYVRLCDKYVLSGEMDYWLDKKMRQNIKDNVDKLRKGFIGTSAANLIMQDQNFKPKSMHDLNGRYTILFIFDPDCGHCREETPRLVDFYNKNKSKFNLETYAVSLDSSMKKMRDYINEMKMTWTTVNASRSYVGLISNMYYCELTPSLYIIDEKKKIIARRLPVEQVEDFLEKYDKIASAKSKTNKGS